MHPFKSPEGMPPHDPSANDDAKSTVLMPDPPEGPNVSTRPVALVGEAHEWTARAIASMLTPEGYSVVHAYTGKQIVEKVRELGPDAVLLNARLPDMEGTEVCRAIRKLPQAALGMPILVLSAGQLTRTRRLEFLRAGAWEFLHFPTHSEELVVKLGTYLETKLAADQLREEGLVDQETGLYNIHGLLRRVQEAGSEASRHRRPLACVVFGPEMDGEEAFERNGEVPTTLSSVVEGFRRMSRRSDSVARLGEAQFIVLAPSTDDAGAVGMARRLIERLEDEVRREAGEAAGSVRLRAGYYAVPDFADAEIEPVEVLARATMALRRSQSDPGGEPIRFYEPNGHPVGDGSVGEGSEEAG